MAVTYMRRLELEPETYDSKFTALTKGVNLKVKNWIFERIESSDSVLEIGCGTGSLAAKIALKGCDVIAIDKNLNMINTAMKEYPSKTNIKLLYQVGTIRGLSVDNESKDKVVSTFMLSELRPLEQQIFLRNAWTALKPNGRLLIAAEFIPSGIWNLLFRIKRWWYKKKLKRLRLESTFLVKQFFKYLNPIGFKVINRKKWKHGSIQAIELEKIQDNNMKKPGYYRPELIKTKGFSAQMKIYRCLFTGQMDHVPIEPGIYRSGKPNENSPIIVTANYIYTYIKVMRALKGLDAWVVCVDSRGINVWCAARGDDFGNKQLIEIVEATDITSITNKKTLILPQLSAGGVAAPLISNEAPKFPFKIIYGPVWAKYIPQYIKDRPTPKPDKMKLAKFTGSHRLRAGITHTTFLFRKIFLLPTLMLIFLLLGLSIINDIWFIKLLKIVELWFWIIITNALIAALIPITKFTRNFIYKGIFFGVVNVIILSSISWFLHESLLFILLNLSLFYWLAFFSTMSFSGYTMETSPREIQEEYPIFRKIHLILLFIGLILFTLDFLLI